MTAVQADARNGKGSSSGLVTINNHQRKLSPLPRLKCLLDLTARLRWRSHFIQKLHDSPSMETLNVCRVYDTLSPPRITNIDHPLTEAWIHGRTGFPLIDAYMRSLHDTGWLNFRMRAMVTSFVTYMLWIDWKCIAPMLARLYIDFAPGIHYPQLQMQAGTTRINALRMYNPTKQARDHDPDGEFVRRYVAELRGIPRRYVIAPSEMIHGNRLKKRKKTEGEEKDDESVLPGGYPARPIVDFGQAYALARKRFAEVRGMDESKAQIAHVRELQGSGMKRGRAAGAGEQRRRRPLRRRRKRRTDKSGGVLSRRQGQGRAACVAHRTMSRGRGVQCTFGNRTRRLSHQLSCRVSRVRRRRGPSIGKPR